MAVMLAMMILRLAMLDRDTIASQCLMTSVAMAVTEAETPAGVVFGKN